MASTDSTKSSVCASGLSFAARNTAGTKASSQSSGLWRISLRSCFMGLVGFGAGSGLEDFADDGEEKARGQSAHQNAGERLDTTDQTPLLRQHEVAVAGGGVGHGAEVKRRRQIGHCLLPSVG